jgi:hypothetical protein
MANASAPRTRTPQSGSQSAALAQENNVLKETVTGLERERDFYFAKLRDIEMLIQTAIEADPEIEKDNNSILKQIQTILYSTEVSCTRSDKHSQETNARNRRVLRSRLKLKVRWKRRLFKASYKIVYGHEGMRTTRMPVQAKSCHGMATLGTGHVQNEDDDLYEKRMKRWIIRTLYCSVWLRIRHMPQSGIQVD